MLSQLNEKNSLKWKLIFYIIFPFGSFIESIFTYKNKYSKVIFILFAILYGLTFVFDENTDGADNARVISEFKHVASLNNGHEISTYFKESVEKKMDVFLPISYILISRFTSEAHWLYGFFAFVYFSFFILSIYFLIKQNHSHNNVKTSVLLLILFAFYIRFSSINGVRFWISAYIYIYSIFQIIINNNKKYLSLLMITPLIHASYFLGVFAVFLFHLLKKNISWCYLLLIISILTPSNFIIDIINNIPFLENSNQSYTAYYLKEGNWEKNIEARANTRWIIRYGAFLAQNAIKIAIFIPIFILKIKLQKHEKRLFMFLIVFFSLLNFSEYSYELYRRFFEIFIMIGIAFFYILSLRKEIVDNRFRILTVLIAILLIPNILFGFRASLETLNAFLLMPGLPILPFIIENISIIDVIK